MKKKIFVAILTPVLLLTGIAALNINTNSHNSVDLYTGLNTVTWQGGNNTSVEDGLTGLDDDVVIWRENNASYELYCPYLPNELNTLENFLDDKRYNVYVSSNTTWRQ